MPLRMHRLWLASLLLAAGFSTSVGAKPPDLPMPVEDQLTPANGPIVPGIETPPVVAPEPTTEVKGIVADITSHRFNFSILSIRCVVQIDETHLHGGAIIPGRLQKPDDAEECARPAPATDSVEALLFDSEDLRQVRAEWRRFWFGGLPVKVTPVGGQEGTEECEEPATKPATKPCTSSEEMGCPFMHSGTMPCRPACPASAAAHKKQTSQPVATDVILDEEMTREVAAKLFEQAQKYVNAGQYTEALEVYATVRCVCPNTCYETQAIGCMNAVSCMLSDCSDRVEASEPTPAVKPQAQQDDCPYLRKKSDKPLVDAPKEEASSVLDNIEKMEKAAQMYKKAEQLMHEGDCERASVYYERIRKLVPGSRYHQMAVDRLAKLNMPTPDSSAVEEATPPPASGDSEDSSIDARTNRLEKKLDALVSINFYQTPLVKVIEDLRQIAGINIVPDRNALEEEGFSLDATVTVHAANVPMSAALGEVCKHVGLDSVVKDGSIYITTRRVAAGPVVTSCYDISDLITVKSLKKRSLSESQRAGREKKYADKVIQAITSHIQPNSWVATGGIGGIEFYPLTKSLVVNHTAATQEQVEEMLARLREEPSLWRTRTVKTTQPLVDPVGKLLEDCQQSLTHGNISKAEDLARQALELDPIRVSSDPLVYKMQMFQSLLPMTKLQPTLPPIDPTIVQAYEQILEMAPPRCMKGEYFGCEASEPMSWVPLKPLMPTLTDADIQKLTVDEECELQVVPEPTEECEPAQSEGKASSLCVDVELNSVKGKRMQVQLQMGRLNLRLVRDGDGKGSLTVGYSVTKED